MKLLQVCNVATRVGGTGACAWTIARCLPDWEHVFAFPVRNVPDGVAEDFGHPCVALPQVRAGDIERLGADAVLWHNSSPYRMPQACPPGVRSLYYQHSAHSACIEARRRCETVWCVSRYLAGLAHLPEESVVYQPVPEPPKAGGQRQEPPTIGRLCTPTAAKWNVDVLVPFYRRLAERHPEVLWRFVGASAAAEHGLRAVLHDNADFLPPSWDARTWLWSWWAVLYTGPPETYGRVVCEAQRARCVPIVDDAGGFREQIVDGETGFLCRNFDAFDAAIERMLSTGVNWDTMQASGANRGSLNAWRNRFLAWLGGANGRQLRAA